MEPFEKPGSRIDVTVSSIGDATSLQGGILLQTPLIGPDGNVYALARGALVVGGFVVVNASTWVTVNHPTVGRGSERGECRKRSRWSKPQTVDILEVEIDRADSKTTKCAADALNSTFGGPIANPIGGRSIRLRVPPDYGQRPEHCKPNARFYDF